MQSGLCPCPLLARGVVLPWALALWASLKDLYRKVLETTLKPSREEGFRGASVCLHCDEDAGSARCPQPSRSSRSPSLLRLHSLCPSDLGSSCSDEVSFCCLYMTYTRSLGGRHQVAHGYVTLDRKTHAGSCETHQRLSLCSVPARVPRCSVCRTGTARVSTGGPGSSDSQARTGPRVPSRAHRGAEVPGGSIRWMSGGPSGPACPLPEPTAALCSQCPQGWVVGRGHLVLPPASSRDWGLTMADRRVTSRERPRVLRSLILLLALPEPWSRSSQNVPYNWRDSQLFCPRAWLP